MDFSELIRISLVDTVLVRQPGRHASERTLRITAHHLILSPKKKENHDEELLLLHRSIDCVERRLHDRPQSGGSVLVKTKDLRIIQIELANAEEFANVAESLEKLSAIEDILRSYAFYYEPDFQPLEDGWTSFSPEVEFSQLIHSTDKEWRMSYVNKDYSICRSYPRSLVVPASISDEQLRASAAFRQGGRFPVLSYRHAPTGHVIVRTSQPLCGPNQRRCRDDERLLTAVLGKHKRGFIIDTRTPATSQSEKGKGGGFELEQHYFGWKVINKSIDRYHFLLDSYAKLMEACSETGSSADKWLSRLTISSWMTHVKEILNAGCLVAQCLDKERASVVVHGSEGVDITLCVTAIAQVILNPDCRTVRGFEALIEREWLQAGHPFWTRTTKGPFNDSVPSKSKNHAPTFTIFLDCVWQIYCQFPCSFEFTEKLLILLSDEAYSSQLGTFLCDNECERALLSVQSKTANLWSHLNRPQVLEEYLNCMYEPNRSMLWPSVAPISLSLWKSKYLRWILDLRPQDATRKRAQEILRRNKEARSNVLKLRKQLTDLTREAEALGLLLPKGAAATAGAGAGEGEGMEPSNSAAVTENSQTGAQFF